MEEHTEDVASTKSSKQAAVVENEGETFQLKIKIKCFSEIHNQNSPLTARSLRYNVHNETLINGQPPPVDCDSLFLINNDEELERSKPERRKFISTFQLASSSAPVMTYCRSTEEEGGEKRRRRKPAHPDADRTLTSPSETFFCKLTTGRKRCQTHQHGVSFAAMEI